MIKYKEVFSTDVNFKDSTYTIVDIKGCLYGFNVTITDDNKFIYKTDVDIEYPDWIDLAAINSFCGYKYNGNEQGTELYQLISDIINYYGAYQFEEPTVYTKEQIQEKFSLDYDELNNDQIIELFFNN